MPLVDVVAERNGNDRGRQMTSNEPDAVTWQRLFASLVGDAAVDAATIREFCSIHGLTPDRVLSEMQTRRQLVQPQQQVTSAASAGLLGGRGGVGQI